MSTNSNSDGDDNRISPPMRKIAYRLSALTAPGIYDLQFVVHPQGDLSLVVKNQGKPHRLEHLGRKPQ